MKYLKGQFRDGDRSRRGTGARTVDARTRETAVVERLVASIGALSVSRQRSIFLDFEVDLKGSETVVRRAEIGEEVVRRARVRRVRAAHRAQNAFLTGGKLNVEARVVDRVGVGGVEAEVDVSHLTGPFVFFRAVHRYDVHEEGLLRMAGRRAEDVAEVVPATWAAAREKRLIRNDVKGVNSKKLSMT